VLSHGRLLSGTSRPQYIQLPRGLRFGVWPEDADADDALRETARALDNVVNVWIDVRTQYRRAMLDLTQTPFGAAKAAAKYIDAKTAQALSQLDKATDSVKRELSELERKHTPKLGTVAETMMESEVRAFLRSLPEHQLAGKLGEAAMVAIRDPTGGSFRSSDPLADRGERTGDGGSRVHPSDGPRRLQPSRAPRTTRGPP
jgi:hypothetical protein